MSVLWPALLCVVSSVSIAVTNKTETQRPKQASTGVCVAVVSKGGREAVSGAGVPTVLISTINLSVSVQLYSEMVVILAITAIAAASTATFSSLWIMLSFYQKTGYTGTDEENACS